jgi:hypothetical protein
VLLRAIARTAFIALLLPAMFSCKKKMICPAYQSTFILDKKTADLRFSGFQIMEEDTLPPESAPREPWKYGILPKLSERKKWKAVKTVEMKLVFAQKPDTTQAFIVLGDSSDVPVSDASTEPIRTEINVDQQNYFLIVGPFLPRPKKVEASKTEEKDEQLEELLSKEEQKEIRRLEKEERRKRRRGELPPPVPYLLPEELLNEDGSDPREQKRSLKKKAIEPAEEDPDGGF